MDKRTRIIGVLLGSTMLFGASQGLAQVTDPATQTAADNPATGEIIVTANKRAENVQKVPISIAVLNNAQLTSAGVSAATQLQITTTNLQIGVLNSQPLIYIRGMGSANLNAGSEGTVGLYLDGIYLPWATAIDSSFLDIERVEVLKGPQGTLYGRNTTAGAINFITRDPSTKRAAELSATIGSWGTQRVNAYLSTGPGTISASIAGEFTHHNPYLRNLGPGPDFNDRDEKGARAKVKWEMSDDWSAVLSVDYTYRRDYDGTGFLSYDNNTYAADPSVGGHYTTIASDPTHTYAEFDSRGERYKNFGASLIIKGDVGFANFSSLTGFRNVRLNSSPDADASDLRLTNFDALNKLKSYSQEFQFVSKPESKLEWVAGLYAFGSQGGLGPVGIFGQGTTGQPIGGFGNSHQFDDADLVLSGFGKSRAYAAYGQASYPIIEGLKLTAGLRYSWERRYLTKQEVTIPALDYFVYVDEPKEHATFHSLDPKAGIEYSFGSNLLYFTFQKGFRSGGYAIASPGAAGPVKPEKVTAFEIGGKHTIVPGVRFNWAMFKYKFKDLQVSRETNNGQGSLFTLQNAADADIKGAEADLTIDAVRNLSFNVGFGYTEAKFKNFGDADAFLPCQNFRALNPDSETPFPISCSPNHYGYYESSVDVSGKPLARAPKFTLSTQATYTIPIGDSRLELSGNAYYSTRYYLDTPSNVVQGRYIIGNIRATYYLPGDHVSIAGFINNVANKRIIEAMSSNAFTLITQPNAPRIIGGTVSLKY